jgi:Pyridoxamine 5'-phosphate oxidase
VAPNRTTGDGDLAGLARTIVDENRYLTLATADHEGMPWASPVWYATENYREFLWVSSPEARHSRNISARPEIAIVIFDSRVPEGLATALYMDAIAERLGGDELERGLAVFSRRSQESGTSPWRVVDEQDGVAAVEEGAEQAAPARLLNLYRATATEHSVLDPGSPVDERAPVSL